MTGGEGRPDEQAEVEQPAAGTEETAAQVARRGPVWVILGVVAAALVVCCCSAVVGLLLSWSAGLFDAR